MPKPSGVTVTLSSGDRSVTMGAEAFARLAKRVRKMSDEELTRLLLLEQKALGSVLGVGEVRVKAEGEG